MTERTKKIVLLSVLALSLIVRLGAIARIANPQDVPRNIAESDSPTYYVLADNLLDGNGYRYSPDAPPTARRTPGYPFFLALIFRMSGRDFNAVRIVQAVLEVITTYMIFATCMILFGSYLAAVLSSLAYAVYIPAVISTTYIMTEALYTFLLLAFTVSCLLAMRSRRYVLFAASGIFFGVATLTRPAALPLPLILLIIALVHKRELWKGFLILGVAFSLTIFPWGFRNKRDLGKFIPTSTLIGMNLYKGNHIPTQGAYFMSTDTLLTHELRLQVADATEVQRDSILQVEAIKMIRAQKLETVLLAFKKIPRLWFNLGYGRKPSNRSLAIAGFHALLLIFGLYGLFRAPPASRYLNIVPVTTIVLTTILYMAVAAEVRFVFPLIPLVLPYSAHGFVSAIERKSGPMSQ